jgi:hypothetical protein
MKRTRSPHTRAATGEPRRSTLAANAGHTEHRARVEVSQNQRLRAIAMARLRARLAANARGSLRVLAANAEKRTAGRPDNSRGMSRLQLERVR